MKLVNAHQSSVKGNGKYGVIVVWKDGISDTEWFQGKADRDSFFKVAKAFQGKKSVRKVNR